MPFRQLAVAHLFVLVGNAVGAMGIAYFSKNVLNFPDSMLETYYLAVTVGSDAAMPIWERISKATSKKMAYILAMAGYGRSAWPGSWYRVTRRCWCSARWRCLPASVVAA